MDSDLVKISSIQIAHSVDMLLNLCGLWASQYQELESGLVQDLCQKILSAVKKLGHNLVLFLQVSFCVITFLLEKDFGLPFIKHRSIQFLADTDCLLCYLYRFSDYIQRIFLLSCHYKNASDNPVLNRNVE